VELFDYIRSIRKQVSRFPSELVEAYLASKVFKSSTTEAGVYNHINFPLRFVVDNDWGWCRLYLSWQRVCSDRLK